MKFIAFTTAPQYLTVKEPADGTMKGAVRPFAISTSNKYLLLITARLQVPSPIASMKLLPGFLTSTNSFRPGAPRDASSCGHYTDFQYKICFSKCMCMLAFVSHADLVQQDKGCTICEAHLLHIFLHFINSTQNSSHARQAALPSLRRTRDLPQEFRCS